MKSVRELMTAASVLEQEARIRAESLEGLVPLEIQPQEVAQAEEFVEEQAEEPIEESDVDVPEITSDLPSDPETVSSEAGSFNQPESPSFDPVAVDFDGEIKPLDAIEYVDAGTPQVEQSDISDPADQQVSTAEAPAVEVEHISADEELQPEPKTDVETVDISDVEHAEFESTEQEDNRLPTVESPSVTDAEVPAIGSDFVSDESIPEVETLAEDDSNDPETEAAEAFSTPDAVVPATEPFDLSDANVNSAESSELPDVEVSVSELDSAPATPQQEPVGFQGLTESPAVTQEQADQQMLPEEPNLSFEERAEKQIEFQMRSNQDLASRLAEEIAPVFDEMRESQTQVVHDFFQSQQLLTSLLRAR